MSASSGRQKAPTIVAIIPMRHFSERVPGKNYRNFAGRPLYHRVVEVLLACREVDTVMIDTDSDVIMEDAATIFPNVRLYCRPDHLRDDKISMNDVLINSIDQVEADFYLQTHSTNPLIKSSTISAAIGLFLKSYPACDSMFSVTRLQTRLWDADVRPINHDPSVLQRTQDLDSVFEENSCFYLFSKSGFVKHRNRIGAMPLTFEIDRIEAQDIDDEVDFRIAEAFFRDIDLQQ